MGATVKAEKRILSSAEFDAVSRSHHPAIGELSQDELAELAKRLRDYRGKARDVARQQRREMRGKAEPRGIRPARENAGTEKKRQVLAHALKRVNRELGRFAKAEKSQGEMGRRALELKRASRVRRHPAAGRTASVGMQPAPNEMPPADGDPRETTAAPEIGRRH